MILLIDNDPGLRKTLSDLFTAKVIESASQLCCTHLESIRLKFLPKLGLSLAQILRLLQLNLFARRPLSDLLKPPDKTQQIVSPQLLLWNQL